MDEKEAKDAADKLESLLSAADELQRVQTAAAAQPRPEHDRLRRLHERFSALPAADKIAVLRATGRESEAQSVESFEKLRSKAPAPLEPLRSSAPLSEQLPEKAAARWAYWRVLRTVELWQAAALSLGREPLENLRAEACGSPPTRAHFFSRLPKEFFDRLKDCQRGLSTDGPIHPQGALYPGVLRDPKCPVLLSEVAAFLRVVGYEVPEEMVPALTEETDSAPEALQDRQDRRLSRLRELGDDMKQVGASWQTVRRNGAMAALEREEAAAGKPMSDKTDIRKDLAAAAEREDAKRAAGGAWGN